MKRLAIVLFLSLLVVGVNFAAPIPIGYISFYSDFFMQTVLAGVKIAASESGNVQVTNAVSETDESKEAKIIDDMVVKGVRAIIITPVSSKGSIAALKRAKDAGVKVICFNTTIDAPAIVSSFIYTPGYEHGAETGKYVANWIKKNYGSKEVKMAMLNCDMYELCVARKQGFFDQLKGLNVKMLTNQQGWVADKAVDTAEAVLQAHKDLDFVWAENEGGTIGLVQAMKTLGLKIPVFGLDMSLQIAQMLLSDDNILQATTGQSPLDIGYLSMKTALDVLNGKEVKDTVYSPVIFFSRDDPSKIKQYIDKNGQIFAMKK